MELILYTTKSDKRKLNKILENGKIIDCKLLDNFNLINPIIYIKNDNDINYNYCYIPKLHRYYFIDNYILKYNSTYTIYLSIDVLMTYKDIIVNSNMNIVKSSKKIGNYIDYEECKDIIKRKISVENPFSENYSDVLITEVGV